MNDSYNILFLCTGNSARSILAEAIMNHRGAPQFHGFSAGSHATGTVNPTAIKLLASAHLPIEGLRSKSWDEFRKPGAPQMDFIFTVCDAAAGESCPLWPGHPITAHWGVPDPAAVRGTPQEIERAFRDAYFTVEKRIELFLSLPHASLDAMEMKAKCADIGRA
jgi:arsenate reductase (thioredoxin)